MACKGRIILSMCEHVFMLFHKYVHLNLDIVCSGECVCMIDFLLVYMCNYI